MSTDLAYLAGLIDGEGYVSINRQTNKATAHGVHYHPVVKLANTVEAMPLFFKERFGGNIERRSYGPDSRWKDATSWSVTSVKLTRPCLEALLPYLRIKRRQAEIVLLLCSRPFGKAGTGGKGLMSEAEFAERERLYTEVIALNRRGRPPATTE